NAPVAIICEQVDDVVHVFTERYLFEQLKTKDRGSWSASSVSTKKGGLDSLVRSYNAARGAGLHTTSTFQLSLEGSMATGKATGDFFSNPTTADKKVQAALVTHGLPKGQVKDFLSRLRIVSGVPSRATIDAVLEQTVGALWPSLSYPERQAILVRLVTAAETAQAHDEPAISMVGSFRADSYSVAEDGLSATPNQVLTRQGLIDLTPPMPSSSREEILHRLRKGEATSALELKMLAAGASSETIEKAKSLRAQADIKRQEAISGGGHGEDALHDLEDRALMLAESVAAKVQLHASVPGVGGRPAEFVFGELMSNLSSLASLDDEKVMSGKALLMVGLVCQVSDECRFWWRP
ncbi:hypothetical protein ACFVW2_35595, partial [Streptomyces sp. NPDC058171]